MATGPMKYGTENDALGDSTTLRSDSAEAALSIYDFNGVGVSALGAQAGVEGRSNSLKGSGVAGHAVEDGMGYGVTGVAGRGLVGEGIGVEGICLSETGVGVHGITAKNGRSCAVKGDGLGRNNIGVAGIVEEGFSAMAVLGASTEGYAGYFNGKVRVSGDLLKSAGGFEIDHPLDPENQTLRHSFVESDERRNIYSDMIVTGDDGRAVVDLPEYCEELNERFRYQLTVVGAEFAQAIVSQEVQEAKFSIKTDQPKVKVSWQVSGTRRDRYAQANSFSPEVEKPEHERGRYLHPEAWGKPKELGVDFEHLAALREQDEERTLPKLLKLAEPTRDDGAS
ncbi:hypothetical protein OG758_12445 [Streptomyces sp. NBC_01474]|uniref:hypothetical protein n=1 Tax=Streptomyces sp. NBC_01474 TaxID=2903880 RepID=UPI002DD98EA7|nr:hypothetical protein [Streptomyces sp. NBC_01474]WSD94863.1 hypothetical protein OG758_12445 [Streptomyces sp. NBC_01474]